MAIKVILVLLFSSALVSVPLGGAQQPAKLFKIGLLGTSPSSLRAVFPKALQELGYVTVSKLRSVAVMWDPQDPGSALNWNESRLGLTFPQSALCRTDKVIK